MLFIEGPETALDPPSLIEPLRAVFIAVSEQRANSAFGLLDLDEGDVQVKAGHLVGGAAFVVKVGSWIPGLAAEGRGAGGGGVVVFSAASGEPLAVIADEHRLTDARTAAAGALATDLLADRAADHVAVLGEILSGTRPGQETAREITIAKLTGLAVQDVVTAERVLERRRTGR